MTESQEDKAQTVEFLIIVKLLKHKLVHVPSTYFHSVTRLTKLFETLYYVQSFPSTDLGPERTVRSVGFTGRKKRSARNLDTWPLSQKIMRAT